MLVWVKKKVRTQLHLLDLSTDQRLSPTFSYLIFLASSLLIVVEDVVADVVLRLPDQQPGAFLHVVASSAGGHHPSQQEEH